MHRIGFIGSGKMAFALAKAMEKNGMVESLYMSDPSEERLSFIRKNTPATTSTNNLDVVYSSDVIFISVKPDSVKHVLTEIKDHVHDQIIISIAAGVRISSMEAVLGRVRIVRVMPNTPCLAGEMAGAYAINRYVDEQDENIVFGILNSAGVAIRVEEEKLDAVTALSGSGPGFLALIAKYMIEAAVKEGLSEKTARALMYQTLFGTGKLLLEKRLHPDELIAMVASPNGTTVAGLEKLKDAEEPIRLAIAYAAKRSRELGKDG